MAKYEVRLNARIDRDTWHKVKNMVVMMRSTISDVLRQAVEELYRKVKEGRR